MPSAGSFRNWKYVVSPQSVYCLCSFDVKTFTKSSLVSLCAQISLYRLNFYDLFILIG